MKRSELTYKDKLGIVSLFKKGVTRQRISLKYKISKNIIYRFLSMLKKIQNEFALNGIKPNKIIKSQGIYLLGYCGNNIVPKVYEYLYEKATIYLLRKKNSFLCKHT